MRELVLGIDTSCYTTSVACTQIDGKLISSFRKLLPVTNGQCGLRQSEAVFVHMKQLPEVMKQMMDEVNDGDSVFRAVCVSSRPRDAEDSYMPVFSAGFSLASSIASILGVPLYQTDHQHGHVAAGLIGNIEPCVDYAVIHMSGGTTELLLSEGEKLTLLGGSMDLHAGQLLDRFGVGLGFDFPAGAMVEKLALSWDGAIEGLIPVSMEKDGLHCHLSGGQNKAEAMLRAGCPQEKAAAELFDFLARSMARMLETVWRTHSVQSALIVGGVASSTLLRKMIRQRLAKRNVRMTILFGDPKYSSDNAAGVAVIGARKYRMEKGAAEDGPDS